MLSDVEREIYVLALEAAHSRLEYTRAAKEGTAIHASIPNILAQIEHLTAALKLE